MQREHDKLSTADQGRGSSIEAIDSLESTGSICEDEQRGGQLAGQVTWRKGAFEVCKFAAPLKLMTYLRKPLMKDYHA